MLKRTQDRKTANKVNKAGTQSVIANAFSLPSGQAFSCPGATAFCEKICYAGKLERMYPSFRRLVVSNYEQLRDASLEDMTVLLGSMVTEFDKECDNKNAPKMFRIHADGDFFSLDYAKAWVRVIRDNPQIHFWVYTRSFTERLNVLPIITARGKGIDNLVVYVSADPVNIETAKAQATKYHVNMATVADTFEDAKSAIGTARPNTKTYKCPENLKSLPLITAKGSACARCGICTTGRGDVLFSRSKH